MTQRLTSQTLGLAASRPDRAGPPTVGGRRISSLANVVLAMVAVVFLLPLAWLLLAAVDPAASSRTQVPETLTLDHFSAVLTTELTLRPLTNSLLLSTVAGTVTVVASVLAAYPLSRYRLRFGKHFLYTVLFGTSLPITAIMVPVYSLAVRAGVLDSLAATSLFMAGASLPIAIWMTKNFMDAVPVSLEEAARVDGATLLDRIRYIIVPLMRPGLGVVFTFVFVQAWGNFFVPFVLLLSPRKQPAAVTIFTFFGQFGTVAYGQLAAFSLIYTVPVIALYAVVSRGLGGSFAVSSGMKG